MPRDPWVIHSLYQPVVDLDTLDVVGFEALARGVPGTSLESAGALFSAARARHDVPGLEWACRLAAMRGAIDTGLSPGQALFINAEPATFDTRVPSVVWAAADELSELGVPVVVEITERHLARNPRSLFAFRDHLTARGWMLAIDDVGADPASLAMLPLLDPDIIKLDMMLVQSQPDIHVARIMNAVNAQASLTGAIVIAEGVETIDQRDHAISFGATLAQGWLFGRPAPLPPRTPAGCRSTSVTSLRGRRSSPTRDSLTPWSLVETSASVRTSTAPMLRAMSRHLESQALSGDDATVVLTAYQNANSLVGRTLATYAAIAKFAFFVGVLGHGVTTTPLPGVHGVDLESTDPLAREWNVIIVTPHFAAALIATEVHTEPPGISDARTFAYVLTYDRGLVLEAARVAMRRFGALAEPPADQVSATTVGPPKTAADKLAAPHVLSVAARVERPGSAGLEVIVRAAGRRDDVEVQYQPIVTAGLPHRLEAVEALLCLDDGHGKQLPAHQFLGLAERLGLMHTFTSRLIEQACAQMSRWKRELGEGAPQTLFVNIGRGGFADVDVIRAVAAIHELPAASLGFEYTANPVDPTVPYPVAQLRRHGHPVALDQYSLLSNPLSLTLEHAATTVKIDRSMISSVVQDRHARAMVKDIIDRAHRTDTTTTAVGVETEAQRAVLSGLGCDFVQGYGIAPPQPASTFSHTLNSWAESVPAYPAVDGDRDRADGEPG